MNDSWRERWVQGHIGWHEPSGNTGLKKHWSQNNRRVLVPLCGKSRDLLWLAEQGNEVVGVELSDIAARAFFDENDMMFRERRGGRQFEAVDRRIRIVCGDYFDFDETGFDAHYDRGALGALPPDLRVRYARHTSRLLTANAFQLAIVLEYEQSRVEGPPFAVFGPEIRSYWPELERIEIRDDMPNCPPKFRDGGLTELSEVVWRTRAGPECAPASASG